MNSRGNAFVYILIAVIMFAALTYALVKANEGGGAIAEVDEGRAEIAANSILAYAAQAQNSLTQLNQTGIEATDLDYILPSDANFNNQPTLHKFFHPEGGGFAYKALPVDATDPSVTGPVSAYYIGRFNNFEWTPTTQPDIVFVAYGLNQATCNALNKKVFGAAVIPGMSADLRTKFVDTQYHGSGNSDLTASDCAGCVDIPAICVADSNTPPQYAFYSILEGR